MKSSSVDSRASSLHGLATSDGVKLEEMAANSYRDFHAKGLDYLCLLRTPELTLKAYFFEGDVSALPEVVVPHDHRYPFETLVLAGRSRNRRYIRQARGLFGAAPYEAFDYMTPLNGGDGFSWSETDWLLETEDSPYVAGEFYAQRADEIHTIQVADAGTVLILKQGADVVPLDRPTRAYRPAGVREPPSLDGLYSPMGVDHVRVRLEQLGALRSLAALLGVAARLAPGTPQSKAQNNE